MKVIVHHLPTGCTWDIEVDYDMQDLHTQLSKSYFCVEKKGGKEAFIFSPNVLLDSVIKVIE